MTGSPTPSPRHRNPIGRRTVIGAAAAAAVAAPTVMAVSSHASPGRGGGANSLQGGGDLGENVIVFDESSSDIQSKLDEIFTKQEKAQFEKGRYALLFKPGTYNGLNAQIGFYTSIMGLGLTPDDTLINGDITVDAGWFDGNATQNFWRSAENLALVPVNGTNRWAVSQAAPFRRMHVKGGLNLAPDGYGWASGGYIADSVVDGNVAPYSQQQWYTRDSQVGGWENAVWNMVFSGVKGAPEHSFPEPQYTTLESTPVSREKPFLYLDGEDYAVFVPEARTDASGPSWGSGTPRGTKLPLTDFYVAKPEDTADTMNQALEEGLHLLLTPGIYHVDKAVEVKRKNAVVLGIGYATLVPEGGATALEVADVDGVRLAGILVDAGTEKSDVLVEIGPEDASGDHSGNPITVQDIFVRIGGAGAGLATTGMTVNAHHTVIDHTWLWRADHGEGVGWDVNPCDYGLIVNGNDVLATGLFVEHFNKYDVQWNGEKGRTIFFQNEKAYDAPDQEAIRNGDIKGYAGYKVGPEVTTHEGWGMGSYCYYNVDPSIRQHHGFAAPEGEGIKFHSLSVVSLGGKGQYECVINDLGDPTSGEDTVPSVVAEFPA